MVTDRQAAVYERAIDRFGHVEPRELFAMLVALLEDVEIEQIGRGIGLGSDDCGPGVDPLITDTVSWLLDSRCLVDAVGARVSMAHRLDDEPWPAQMALYWLAAEWWGKPPRFYEQMTAKRRDRAV